MIEKNFEKANILLSNLLHMQLTFVARKIQVKLLTIISTCNASTLLIEKNDNFQLGAKNNMVLISD